MLLVVMLILMFANLVMLLKGVLGYDFRDNRIMVIAGAAMIMLYWWLEIAPPDWGYLSVFSAVVHRRGWNFTTICREKVEPFSLVGLECVCCLRK